MPDETRIVTVDVGCSSPDCAIRASTGWVLGAAHARARSHCGLRERVHRLCLEMAVVWGSRALDRGLLLEPSQTLRARRLAWDSAGAVRFPPR
jgi:hypothetical protein